tara:strand:- start:15210 stop:15878 length:669 start_codon:yes stop_codon:yes gene_type:complete
MRHIDVGENIDIPYKKVGITGKGSATLDSRLRQISRTKSPIKAQLVAAWQHASAKDVEAALHSILDDRRIEGEWFLDKDDTLVESMRPIMKLLKATELPIAESQDEYTKSVMRREEKIKEKAEHSLIAEITKFLEKPLSTSTRIAGPTFFSDEKKLTYYIAVRKSGRHLLKIGRSKPVYKRLSTFLEDKGYEVAKGSKGAVRILGVEVETIAGIINQIEKEF